MKIINVEYKITTISYIVKYKSRINKNVDIYIENMLCFGMLYILCTNRFLVYRIDTLKIPNSHLRNLMSTKEYYEILTERNNRLDKYYNPKPINIGVLF